MTHRTCPRCGTTRRIHVGTKRLDTAETAAAAEVRRRTGRMAAEAEARLRALQADYQAVRRARAEAGGDQ